MFLSFSPVAVAGYAKKKKKKQNRTAMLGIILVMCALLTVLGYQTMQLQARSDEYTAKLEAIQAELEAEKERSEELEAEKIYTQSKQYVEQEAKEKLGLVNPNEIILKPEE